MSYERASSGTRLRADGGGDGWANSHRSEECLGRKFYLQDIDGYFGFLAFAGNTGDRLFVEYEPDSYENRDSSMREFAVVALFDRKKSEAVAFGEENRVSSNFYRFLCRAFAERQPIMPRFFYVIGSDQPPWILIDVNLATGEEKSRWTLGAGNWSDIWRTVGLTKERDTLRRWITSARP